MAESNDTPVQVVLTGSVQEVQGRNWPLPEGYQPLDIERKGYQPTDTPPPQSPPQSVSGIFTYGEALAAPPLALTTAPAAPAQAQSANTASAQSTEAK